MYYNNFINFFVYFKDVDPRSFPATSQHMFQMPIPPPQYNSADMLGVGIENNTTSTTSSGEPPAYTSISESHPPSSSKTTATVAATISNNNNHQAALKSESSGMNMNSNMLNIINKTSISLKF